MATALKRAGIGYKIIDQAARLSDEGAGICLPANAIEGLQALGLKDTVVQAAQVVERVSYLKPGGEVITTASLLEPPLNCQPFVALPRRDLVEIIGRDILDDICFDCYPVKTINHSSNISITLNNGDSDRYDLVIAADGIHSSTRDRQFAKRGTMDLGVGCWRFIVDTPLPQLQPQYYIGRTDAFMLYPLPNGQVYCYAQAADKHQHYTNADAQPLLQQLFAHYCPDVRRVIDQAEGIITGRLESVLSREVYSGRIVAIGDALHGCPPSLQQGVGLTVEDVLALSAALQQDSIEQALAQFKAARLARLGWVINESNKVINLASKGNNPLVRMVRNYILRKHGPANVVAWRKILQHDV
ncbi:Aurachin C monooxygenase/isomerase [Sinobacterium norvegicum]|uniref:Aurachin C monooxygenase/isomerase n=2 Tax=Sinobacterium norvegicum TaxID=1641715 RepID=A0ABN8EE90_9GAMM|nr:Aurachin C monooxygenase/isomerase [Sinobacterium norvegicum]